MTNAEEAGAGETGSRSTGGTRPGTPPGRDPGDDAHVHPVTIRWTEDGRGLRILDQTELPARRMERELRTLEEIVEAIRMLRVRGAPLIGITAAMGVAALARQVLEAEDGPEPGGEPSHARVLGWCERLEAARPTAVNLGWALARMRRVSEGNPGDGAAGTHRDGKRPTTETTGRGVARGAAPPPGGGPARVRRLHAEASRILEEDRAMCRRIGRNALPLLKDGAVAVTHCNAGALATGGIGTALAPLYLARERGWKVRVFADETRPLLQGSRLTAWELGEAGIDVTVLADGMAGALMAAEPPDVVLVGADRIAANGDVANKIGTYGLAVLARHHGVPFYVLAPTSTVDLETPSGAEIPIEHREADEIRLGFGKLTAPVDAGVWSPAFDVTPAELVTGIVTEQGICRSPYGPALRAAVEAAERERAAGKVAAGAIGRSGEGTSGGPGGAGAE